MDLDLITKKKITGFKLIFFTIIFIWTLPTTLLLPDIDLDSSWIIGLNMGLVNNFQFGRELIIHCGPLGFLLDTTFVYYNLWLYQLFFTFFIHFIFILSIILLLSKLSARYIHYLYIAPVLLASTQFILMYKLYITLIILFYMISMHHFPRKVSLLLIFTNSILMAIASLIKFVYLAHSLMILVSFLIVTFLKSKNNKILPRLLGLLTYSVFILFFWHIAGQKVVNLPDYFFNGWQFVNGYNEINSTTGPAWQIYIGSTFLILFFILFLISIIHKNVNLIKFFILIIGFIIIAFKHGFVMHDYSHIHRFFMSYAILFSLLTIILKLCWDTKKIMNPLAIFPVISIIPLLSLILILNFNFPEIHWNIFQNINDYKLSLNLMTTDQKNKKLLINNKKYLRNKYALDNKMVRYIDNKTVDIFPWDISLSYAYNWNWSPRPVFQSLSITSYLDKLNSKHFIGDNSPEVVIYSYKSIHNKYPLLYEPLTFRTILFGYKFHSRSKEFIALTKTDKRNLKKYSLRSIKCEFNKYIEVPEFKGLLFMKIDIHYSLYGKLKKSVYKPSHLYMQFLLKNGQLTKKYRFSHNPAKNGIFISRYIKNNDELIELFQGVQAQNIKSIIIITDNINEYKDMFNAEFIGYN